MSCQLIQSFLLILLVKNGLFVEIGQEITSSWSYNKKTGPSRWCDIDKQCCGLFQSPIDIGAAFRIRFPLPIIYSNYDLVQEYELINTGTTALLTRVRGNGLWAPTITGGPLTGWYVFQEAHFHWGLKSSRGSEHTVNGHKLPLEMHIVHKNAKYTTFEDAYKNTDGLSVVSVLFKVSSFDEQDNDINEIRLEPLINALKEITCKSDMTTVTLSLDSLMPPSDLRTNYVSYFGSVTRPPCSQSVTWIVLENFGRIGETQMKVLRHLRTDDSTLDNGASNCAKRLVDNFRPTQKINHRLVVETQ